MSDFQQFSDPFLAGLSRRKREAIETRRESWGMSRSDFYSRVESWFANFDERDKPLALKVLLKLQYYNADQFERRIRDLWLPVARFLHETGNSIRDVILVVPDERADSADRHAYDVIKKFSLEQLQVLRTLQHAEFVIFCHHLWQALRSGDAVALLATARLACSARGQAPDLCKLLVGFDHAREGLSYEGLLTQHSAPWGQAEHHLVNLSRLRQLCRCTGSSLLGRL